MLTPAEYYRVSSDQVRYVRSTTGVFEDAITKGQKKRIAKCARLGMRVTRSDVEACHPIIADNRSRKGRPYSMSLVYWQALRALNHLDVKCFAVEPGPVAVAMCVLVQPEILYVQAWGDVAGQEQNSPVTILCRGIFNWCQENGVTLLDIGTADDAGLIAFKESLGFRRSR